MSRRNSSEKPAEEKRLNFPDLYDVIDKNLRDPIILTDSRGNKAPVKHTNPAVISLIFGIARTDNTDRLLEGNPDVTKNLSSEASAFMSRRSLPPDVVEAYHDVRNSEYVYSYVSNEIFSQITDVEQLEKELKNLINNTPKFPQKEAMQKQEDVAKLLAECLKVATSHRFRVIDEKKRINEKMINEQEKILGKGKGKCNVLRSTHAISIIVEGDGLQYPPFNLLNGSCEFHDFESMLEYIVENNLLILKVYSLRETVRIFVMPSKYRLKKISEKEYVDAIAFLGTYQHSFKAKKSWPKYSIACLASEGLKERKWTPYGYYMNNELIGYIDYKYTVKNGVELGIELIDREHRSQALATSLLYFVRLKFPTLCTYSGTYEENAEMRSTFEAAGYIIDTAKGKDGIIKDRVNKECPEDESLYTNSVYYIAAPILDQYYIPNEK